MSNDQSPKKERASKRYLSDKAAGLLDRAILEGKIPDLVEILKHTSTHQEQTARNRIGKNIFQISFIVRDINGDVLLYQRNGSVITVCSEEDIQAGRGSFLISTSIFDSGDAADHNGLIRIFRMKMDTQQGKRFPCDIKLLGLVRNTVEKEEGSINYYFYVHEIKYRTHGIPAGVISDEQEVGANSNDKVLGLCPVRELPGKIGEKFNADKAALKLLLTGNEELQSITLPEHGKAVAVENTPGALMKRVGLFISYTHMDISVLTQVIGELAKRGIQYWADVKTAQKGGFWEVDNGNAIDLSTAFVSLESPDYLASPNVECEVKKAIKRLQDNVTPYKILRYRIKPMSDEEIGKARQWFTLDGKELTVTNLQELTGDKLKDMIVEDILKQVAEFTL